MQERPADDEISEIGFYAFKGLGIVMTSIGQSRLQKPQPMHARASFRYGKGSTPLLRGCADIARQPTGQASIQIPQATQAAISICGFGHSDRLIMVHGEPFSSSSADCGHILPHAPHSMHKPASIE